MSNQHKHRQTAPMTQARRQLVDPTQAGTFHCVNRCVRRSWLCGLDKYLGKRFEHRKSWVQTRIFELGNIFACGIYSWAVMSNHLHLVVHMSPSTSLEWSPAEVATRWAKLYPAHLSSLVGRNSQFVKSIRSIESAYGMPGKLKDRASNSGISGRFAVPYQIFFGVIAKSVLPTLHHSSARLVRWKKLYM